MKTVTSKFKKHIIYLIMIFTLSSIVTPIEASAASYPSCYFFSDEGFTNQIVEDTANVGDIYKIRMLWFAKYNNEGYEINVKNSSGKTVATASKTWSNNTYQVHVTVDWDTKGYDAGQYEVEVTPKFYSFYRWNEAPYTSTLYVTLNDKKGSKTDSSISAVKNLKVKNISKKSLNVSYSKIDNADKYKIQYSLDKNFKRNVKTKKTSKTNYKIKNLKKGKTYYVRVCGIKGSSQGKWSSVRKVKIKK